MLQSESSKAEVDAAHTRVKTEELARAIAALESRRQEDARRLEGTLVIGDALKELQVDATAEEVLAEVEAQRATRQVEDVTAQEAPAFNWRRPAWIAGLCAAGAWIGWTSLSSISNAPPRHLQLPPQVQQPATYPYDVDAVADIPDGRAFYCLPSEIQEIINEPAILPQVQVVSVSGMMQFAPWTMVKHSGHAYVRGWIHKPSDTSGSVKGNVLVYNVDPEAASHLGLVPVTMRVGNFHSLGFYTRLVLQDESMATQVQLLSVADLHLDKYAWEKW